ncbi:MAG: hypothetical protein K1X83_11550 [Oligoflexia bacterium]|nr:hypothetical protein [Oligoflexia bacterium]
MRNVPTAVIAVTLLIPLLGAEAQAKKNYLCNLEGAIWNQSVPCDQDSPERGIMKDRLHYEERQASRKELARLIEEHKTEGTIARLQNFPERYDNQDILLKEVWLYGNVIRLDESWLPAGEQTELLIKDKFDRALPVLASNNEGIKLLDRLKPNLAYPLTQITVRIINGPSGYYASLIDLSISDQAPKKVADWKSIPQSVLLRAAPAASGSEVGEGDDQESFEPQKVEPEKHYKDDELPPDAGDTKEDDGVFSAYTNALKKAKALGKDKSYNSGLEQADPERGNSGFSEE